MAVNNIVVVNEVLWFVNIQFSRVAKSEISGVLSTFSTFDELVTAYRLLFDFMESLTAVYLAVYTERKGQNKTKATIDDTLGLFTLLYLHAYRAMQYWM